MPAALVMARYPLVAMCEGDDFWIDSQKLHIQAELLESNPSWAAVTHNHFDLNEACGQLLPGRSTKTCGFLSQDDLLNINLVLWVHTLMIRRSLCLLPSYNHLNDILGDQVMTVTLGLSGSVYFKGDLLGSVARRNLASTYTPLHESVKQIKRIKTREFLAQTLQLRGQNRAASRMKRWAQAARQQLLA